MALVHAWEYIYTSSDSGTTWSEVAPLTVQEWYPMTASADGIKMVAGVFNGYLYTR